MCIPRWCLPSPSLAYNALQIVEATVGAKYTILCRVAADFSSSAVLACFRGYPPGNASSTVQSRCWNWPSSCRWWSTRYGCCTGSIMFNHEAMSGSALPTRRELSNRDGDTEKGKQVETRIKPLVSKRLIRQKLNARSNPPLLRGSQAIKPTTRWAQKARPKYSGTFLEWQVCTQQKF